MMAVTFLTGKPGGGKSLRAISVLLDCLLDDSDRRKIVTNLNINLDQIQAWCWDQGLDIKVEERVYLMDDAYYSYPDSVRFTKLDWLRKFYLNRGDCSYLEWPPDTDLEDYFKPLYLNKETGEPTGRLGCLYIIDETRKLYPSSNNKLVDARIYDYLSLHRHFGDDVYFICQFTAQITSQVRGNAQFFEVMRNRGKEQFGKFAGPKTFVRYVYSDEKCTQGQHDKRVEFRLDLDRARCYNTSVFGGDADKGQSAKGIPYFMIYVLIALACVGIWFVLGKGPDLVLGATNKAVEKKVISQAELDSESSESELRDHPHVSDAETHEVLYYESFRMMDLGGVKTARVNLPDGRFYTHLDPEFERIDGSHRIWISGKVYYPKPYESIPLAGGHSGVEVEPELIEPVLVGSEIVN